MSNTKSKAQPKMTAQDWRKLADLARAAQEAIDQFELAVLLQMGSLRAGPEQTALMKVADMCLQNPLVGLPYMLTPQSQWMGGETWKTKQPHIVGTFTDFIEDEPKKSKRKKTP